MKKVQKNSQAMPYHFHLPKYYPNFNDPLHKAAYLGDNNAIKKTLKSNTVCIYELVDGFTALGIALAQNHQPIEMINIYKMDKTAVRNAISNTGLPPILVAFGKDQVKKIKTMSKLPSKNDETKSNIKKMTILLKETNDKREVIEITPVDIVDALKIVKELLPNGLLDLNHEMKSDLVVVNFLHLAAMNGMTDLLIQLIELGAHLNTDPSYGKLIPLNLAIANGQLETVKFLLNQADSNLFNTYDKRLVADAVGANEYSVFEYLIEIFAAKKQEKESMSRTDALRLLMPDVEACFHDISIANGIFNNVEFRNILDLSNMLHRCALNSTFSHLAMELIKLNFDWLLVERDDNYLRQPVTAFHMIVSQGWPEIETIYRQYPMAKNILFSNPLAGCRAFDYGLCLHQISDDLAEFLFKTHRDEIIEMNLISPLLSSSIKRNGYNKLIDLLLDFASAGSNADFSKPILTSLEYRNYDVTEQLLNDSNCNENIINVRDDDGNNLLYYTMWETPRRQSRYSMCCQPPRGTDEEREQRRLRRQQQLQHITEHLLKIGVDINHRNNKNQTLLHRAVSCNDAKSVEKYLRLGLPVNVVDENGATPLHFVLNTNILRQLINHSSSAEVVNAKDNNGDTVLHHMVRELDCNRSLLENVIGYGADVNAKNNEQRTPLFYVTSDECALILIEFGANSNARDVLKSLIESSKYTDTLISNDGLGHVNLTHLISFPDLFTTPSDQIKELVKTQCNTVDIDGSPMLCAALFQRNEMCAKMLLNESTIDVNAKDSRGQSAIHLAYNCPNLIEDLLKKGAAVNALDDNRWTPLMHAIKWNCNDAAENFLKANVEVNVQNIDGDTALHFAAQANNFPLMIDIIDHNGNWNICNQKNEIAFDLFADSALKKLFKNIL